ncbi:MAG: peptidase M20 [Promethearchaeota archaeon CR_4]|nr:MAG: peptidase M20 [Candidatus Lokiarchaeota archaeon CR_4]
MYKSKKVVVLLTSLADISAAVDQFNTHQFVEFLDQLVRINTTVPPGLHYSDFIAIISPRLEALGFALQIVKIPDEFVKQAYPMVEGSRINLVAIKDLGQEKTITFYGHMDVVPAPNEGNEKWRTDPFKATLKGKRIFGRGVADMKGSIAALIIALELLQKLDLKPKYNIRFVACTDEELGGKSGVYHLAEQGFLKGTIFCMDALMWDKYVVGALGDLLVEIEVVGMSCHSGLNFLGINAIEAIVPILIELLKLRKKVEARRSTVPGIPRPETPTERNMSPMLNLSIIRGGIKNNIVPGTCQLTIDRRLIPEEKIDDVTLEIMEAINRGKAKSSAKDVKVNFQYLYAPLKVDPTTSEARRMQQVICRVNNIKSDTLQQLALPASTDIGFLNDILKTKDIILRGVANASSNPHGVNEIVSLVDIFTFIKEILLFLAGDDLPATR